jgi:hypothetical protein
MAPSRGVNDFRRPAMADILRASIRFAKQMDCWFKPGHDACAHRSPLWLLPLGCTGVGGE